MNEQQQNKNELPDPAYFFLAVIFGLCVIALFIPIIDRAIDIGTCHCHRDILPYYTAFFWRR